MKKILTAALVAAMLLCVATGALAATGLGSVTEVSNTAATADKAGSVSVNTTMCAVTLDDEGKIVNDVAAVGIAGILQGIGAMGGR